MNVDKTETLDKFGHLIEVLGELREKCPWDRKQTVESLRQLTIEETFELSDAILSAKPDEIKKELGDLLLHVVFYSRLAQEQEWFDLNEVIETLIAKLKRRHPHIYGDVEATDSKTVEENWEKIKLSEKDRDRRVLSGVPSGLPPMIKAFRIQQKARGVGFDWEHREQVWNKVKEELHELIVELNDPESSAEKAENEFGDLIFAMINAGRLFNIDPEKALEMTNRKFIRRFNYLEDQTLRKGKNLHDMSLDEMEEIWQEAKKNETDR